MLENPSLVILKPLISNHNPLIQYCIFHTLDCYFTVVLFISLNQVNVFPICSAICFSFNNFFSKNMVSFLLTVQVFLFPNSNFIVCIIFIAILSYKVLMVHGTRNLQMFFGLIHLIPISIFILKNQLKDFRLMLENPQVFRKLKEVEYDFGMVLGMWSELGVLVIAFLTLWFDTLQQFILYH